MGFWVVILHIVCFEGNLAFGPSEQPRAYRLLDSVAEGCPGHGPVHWMGAAWAACPQQKKLSGGVSSTPGLRCLTLGRIRLLLTFVSGKDSEGARCWMLVVHCSSLTLTMFGREKALLRGVLVGGVWNGFFVGESEKSACAVLVLWWCRWSPFLGLHSSSSG